MEENEWKDDVVPCYYCGASGDEKDHVIPTAILKKIEAISDLKLRNKFIKNRTLIVPACRECNTLLSHSYQKTLDGRKKELKKRLKRKYKKILSMPDWTKTEIKHLGSTLKQTIQASCDLKDLIKRRLRW